MSANPISNNSILPSTSLYFLNNILSNISSNCNRMLKVIESSDTKEAYGHDCVLVRILKLKNHKTTSHYILQLLKILNFYRR